MGATTAKFRLFSFGMWLLGRLVTVDAVWAQGGMSFTRRDFRVRARPFAVTVGNFNGDSRPDLATSNASTVSILLGQGDGSFEATPNVGVEGKTFAVIGGDFNDDGQQDVATANNLANTVSILLGQGNGTFQAAPDIAVGEGSFSIAVADMAMAGRIWRRRITVPTPRPS